MVQQEVTLFFQPLLQMAVVAVVLKQQEVMVALVVVVLVLIQETLIEMAAQETRHLLHQAKETMAVLGLYRIA
jgi:hypothetical protein